MNKKKVQVIIFAKKETEIVLLLLQTRPDRNEHWQNITGGVDEGETFERAAQRELQEETGIVSELRELDLEFNFHDRWGKDVLEKVYFQLLDQVPQNITLCEKEHQAYKWLPISDVTKNHFGYPSNFEAFSKAKELI
ncbi:NUDIX domain-containing protein [Halobacteriovorax sp. GB3]|uniref:NUDIX domain-containing protein n=1 Tax=Halobacteriovorax sp. GB3 TaxID=2719615 RepID=UPI00235E24AC|nr:NUDIX domain-containing protein [Halobacteriovorax sp. GB3]MDD0852582.1 NUDIX domain-containing protein [Halobacteriovorax sp. GB3]